MSRGNFSHHTHQIGIALDQLCNTLLGGWADETFSSRCWRHRDRPGWKQLRKIVDCLFFWEKNHCRESYNSEVKAAQLPASFRLLRLLKGVSGSR